MSGKSLASRLLVPVRRDLASEFFNESGDLPIAGFPATNELATIVGKMLGFDRDERAKLTLETVKSRKIRKR